MDYVFGLSRGKGLRLKKNYAAMSSSFEKTKCILGTTSRYILLFLALQKMCLHTSIAAILIS